MSRRTVEQHLGTLRALGLVEARRDAQTVYYRLTDHPFNKELRELETQRGRRDSRLQFSEKADRQPY